VGLVTFGYEITDAGSYTARDRGEQRDELRDDNHVVAVECYHLQRDKKEDEELVALDKYEILDFMDEDLLGLGNHLRVLLKKLTSLTDIDLQPGIFFVDLPVKDDTAYDGKKKFDGYPNVEVLVGIGQINL
jgi:hypothetical protein